MLCALKKTIGVCLVGIGLGVLLVLLLPTTGWLFLIGIANLSYGTNLAILLKNKRRVDKDDNCSKKSS